MHNRVQVSNDCKVQRGFHAVDDCVEFSTPLLSVGVVPERASQVPSQPVEAATATTAGAGVRRRPNELVAADGRMSTPGAVGPSPHRRHIVLRRHRRRR